MAFQQVASVGLNSRWGTALENALHLPWFAVLTALLLVWSRRWRITGRVRWWVIIGTMLLGATGSELVNALVGRDAQLQDAVRDLLGGSATLLGTGPIAGCGQNLVEPRRVLRLAIALTRCRTHV